MKKHDIMTVLLNLPLDSIDSKTLIAISKQLQDEPEESKAPEFLHAEGDIIKALCVSEKDVEDVNKALDDFFERKASRSEMVEFFLSTNNVAWNKLLIWTAIEYTAPVNINIIPIQGELPSHLIDWIKKAMKDRLNREEESKDDSE